MEAGVGLLILYMMPISMIIALDIIIITCFSNNCPTVICLPTYVIFSREATSEIYGPGVHLLPYCFLIYLLWYLFSYIFIQSQQINVRKLIEEQILMTISKAMIMDIGIMSKISRPTPACIYYYYSTIDRYPACI